VTEARGVKRHERPSFRFASLQSGLLKGTGSGKRGTAAGKIDAAATSTGEIGA
jgi:hypothetical protein